MLVDTEVLVFNQRGNERAVQWLDTNPRCSISAVTWMELVQGVRNGCTSGLLALRTKRPFVLACAVAPVQSSSEVP